MSRPVFEQSMSDVKNPRQNTKKNLASLYNTVTFAIT